MYDLIKNQYGCHYESFGETWRKRKCNFFGHILRCRSDDPLFQVTFSHTIFSSRTPPLLRPGRPRADWLIETFKDSCYYLYGPDRQFDFNDRQLIADIKQAAVNRIGPFSTNKWCLSGLLSQRPLASRGTALGNSQMLRRTSYFLTQWHSSSFLIDHTPSDSCSLVH